MPRAISSPDTLHIMGLWLPPHQEVPGFLTKCCPMVVACVPSSGESRPFHCQDQTSSSWPSQLSLGGRLLETERLFLSLSFFSLCTSFPFPTPSLCWTYQLVIPALLAGNGGGNYYLNFCHVRARWSSDIFLFHMTALKDRSS